MNRIILGLSIFLLINPPVVTASQGNNYVGAQYALVTIPDDSGLVGDVDPAAGVIRLGTYINDAVSVEGRFGIGLAADTKNIEGVDVDFDVDTIVGFYGVFNAQTNSDASVYAVIGYSDVELEASVRGLSVGASESGLSFGFGAKVSSFTLEYMSYLDESDAEAAAISFGFVSNF